MDVSRIFLSKHNRCAVCSAWLPTPAKVIGASSGSKPALTFIEVRFCFKLPHQQQRQRQQRALVVVVVALKWVRLSSAHNTDSNKASKLYFQHPNDVPRRASSQ